MFDIKKKNSAEVSAIKDGNQMQRIRDNFGKIANYVKGVIELEILAAEPKVKCTDGLTVVEETIGKYHLKAFYDDQGYIVSLEVKDENNS